MFYLIPGTGLPHGLLPLESLNDLDDLLNLVVYSHHHVLYTTKNKVFLFAEINDFEFTQLFEDQRVERIEMIREEVVPTADEVKKPVKKPVKKKRRIPPPTLHSD